MNDQYKINGPAMISFSGGRTSGFMLRKILEAHGGTLPEDVVTIFNNTGREHEATLQFVRDVGKNWNVPIVWLEYVRVDDKSTFKIVDYCSAARNGEPFAELIKARGFLPNPIARFCSVELKIRTSDRYRKSLGWGDYDRAIGLRADEPRRVARMKGDNKNENVLMPMAQAGHTLADVLAFWKTQPFDLMLPGGDNRFGNCDLCFLKGRAKIETIMRTNPESAAWWIEQEKLVGATFRIDRPSYKTILTQVTTEGRMFNDNIEDDTLPCMCTE